MYQLFLDFFNCRRLKELVKCDIDTTMKFNIESKAKEVSTVICICCTAFSKRCHIMELSRSCFE